MISSPSSTLGRRVGLRTAIGCCLLSAISGMAVTSWVGGNQAKGGENTARTSQDVQASAVAGKTEVPRQVARRSSPAVLNVPPSTIFQDLDEAEADEEQRRIRARDVVKSLDFRILPLVEMLGDKDPETVVGQVAQYAQGIADTLTIAAPDIIEDVAQTVEQRLCDHQATDSMKLLMLRIAMAAPDTASTRGLECIVSRNKGEDVLTWTALQTWKTSGLPQSEALETLRRRASDQRTTNLLARWDPESADSERE